MFNVGGPEILVIILVALVVLGPDQLPKAMRTFGNVMGEIRKVSNGFQTEMRNAMNTVETTVSGSAGAAATNKPNPSSAASSSDVNETVASNRPDRAAELPAPADPVSNRPPIDPVDRAAG